ncbi:MAG: hypothetical protein ABIQ09_10380 [Jatrophihabitantaceae bacterium]
MKLAHPVNQLVSARRLERVPADVASARLRLERAEEKLEAARKIAEIDVEVAYVTAYDATRIAITAHMPSLGLRVRGVAGAHEAGRLRRSDDRHTERLGVPAHAPAPKQVGVRRPGGRASRSRRRPRARRSDH